MSTLGSIVVSLEANIARFESDLSKAEQVAKGAFDRISKAGDMAANAAKTVGLAVAGIGAGIGVATLVSKFESVTASLAGMKEMAERTGSSVESLSGLAAVAKIGGRDMGELEGAVSRLNKSLHANDDESKGAGKALAALGLNINDLKRMDPAQAFMTIAKAQEQFADSSGKSAVMMDIMGKSGAKQIPLLHDMAEQGDLVVKTTTKQAEAADRLEKDLNRLKATKEALYKVVAVELIPVYDSFVKVLIQANNESDGLRKTAKDLASDGSIRSWAEAAAIAAAHVIDEFQLIKAVAIEIATPIERVGRNIYTLGALASVAVTGSLDEKRQAYAALKAENEKYFGELDARLAKNRTPVALYSDRLKTMLEQDRKAASASEGKKSLADYTGRTPTDGKNTPAAAAKSDPLGAWIKSYEAMLKPANDALDNFTKLQRDAEESGYDLTKSEKAFYTLINSPEWQNMGEPWKELVRAQFEAANAAEHAAKSEREFNALMANTPTAKIEEARGKMLLLAEAFEKGRINEQQFIEAANGVNGVTDQLEKTTDQMDEFAKKAAGGIQQSMAEFLFNPFQSGLKGLGQQFGVMLQKMMADAAAAQFARLLFGNMGVASGGQSGNWGWLGSAVSIAGSLFGGGDTMPAGSGTPGAFPAAGDYTVPQYAVGTDYVPSDMLAYIHKGEKIVPAAYNTAGLNGMNSAASQSRLTNQTPANITIHVNSQTGDSAEIRRSAAAGARTALGAMSGARRYG